jgi:cysteine synthase A
VVGLQRLNAGHRAWVGVKLESLSLTGAAQDRLAIALVDEAEQSGQLSLGGEILEASGGNLAVSLALVCAARGYRFIAVVPESISEERLALLRAYGAQCELTPDAQHIDGALARAEALSKELPAAYWPRQFSNPTTVRVYEETLGAELNKTAELDGGADALVGASGTGGMLRGTAVAMSKRFPKLAVVEARVAEHPHHVQGVDTLSPTPLRAGWMPIQRTVSQQVAVQMQRRLASEEGLLLGFSSGLAVAAALELAAELGPGKRVYVLGCDSGERYFSLQRYFP